MNDVTDLYSRLLDAADVMEEFNKLFPDLYDPDTGWTPSALRDTAKGQSALECEIAELAEDIFTSLFPTNDWGRQDQRFYLRCARAAVDKGWEKS